MLIIARIGRIGATLLIVTAVVACAAPSRPRGPSDDLKELLKLDGVDLLEVEESKEHHLLQLVRRLVPYSVDRIGGTPPFQPWRIWSLEPRYGTARAILLEVALMGNFPGTEYARVHLFDGDGNRLSSTSFQLGWRLTTRSAELVRRDGWVAPVIRIGMTPEINARWLEDEYYSFVGTDVALIRLEGKEGRSEPNIYSEENHTIGPELPDRGADQWIAALRSPDPVERLRSLVWLDGAKPRDLQAPLNPGTHYATTAELVTGERVLRAIRALIHDPEPWIREQARRFSE